MRHHSGAEMAPLITGAILAGGFSRRLGQDKAMLRLGGIPLALRVDAALAPLATTRWLITNHPLAHMALGLPLVTDLRPHLGPAGGLATALFYARTPWVLVVAVDSPFLASALLTELISRTGRTSRPAIVCQSPRGLEPFPGLYAVRLLPALQEFTRTGRSLTSFLEKCRPQIIPEKDSLALDPENRSFFNLNTPRDLAQAVTWLSDGAS